MGGGAQGAGEMAPRKGADLDSERERSGVNLARGEGGGGGEGAAELEVSFAVEGGRLEKAAPVGEGGRQEKLADETCPVSTEGGTRRVRLVRKEGRDVSG